MEPGQDRPLARAAPKDGCGMNAAQAPSGVPGPNHRVREAGLLPPAFWLHRVLSGSPRPTYGQGLQALLCLRLEKDRPLAPRLQSDEGTSSLPKGHLKHRRLPVALTLLA